MKLGLAITGVGLISPIGHTALACMHAVRSNQSGLSLLPLPDRVKTWIAGGKIPQWTPYGGRRHWETLGGIAIKQAWDQANRGNTLTPSAAVSLVLGRADAVRPSPVFPHADFDASGWMNALLGRSPENVSFVQAGACNAQAGLRVAAQRFAAGKSEACIIGAVDSQAQLRVTRWHEDNLRLKCSYVTDGLMPSEAAAFLMVEPFERAERRGANILACVESVSGGLEESTLLSDLPNAATAMSQVVGTALREAGVHADSLSMVWTDLNGESYKAREWAFTSVRLGIKDSTRLMHPADCHGDLGGATDTHLLGIAAMAQATSWSTEPMLVVSGSDVGIRAATVVSHCTGRTGVVQVSGNRPRVLSGTFRLPLSPEEPEDFRETDDPPKTWFQWHTRHAHQDDIAGLFYQRCAMLADRGTAWPRLIEPEMRLLEHFDAVVAAGPDAMAFQAGGLDSEEAGVSFGAAMLIGQIPSPDNLNLIARALAGARGLRLVGLTEGLMHSPLGSTLQDALNRWVESDTDALRAVAIRLLARHRISIAPPKEIDEYLRSYDTALELADASWRLGWSSLVPVLKNLLGHERVELRQSALTALICFVPEWVSKFCRSRVRENAAFGGALATGLAICGSQDNAEILLRRAEEDPTEHSMIEALGIWGDVKVLPLLVGLLDSDEAPVVARAEQALHLITGRNMSDDATAASTSQTWRRWLADEGRALDGSKRWRRGRPFTAAACIDELADPLSPIDQRRRAQRELVRWAGSRIAYEPDAFATIQAAAIAEMRS